MPRKTKLVEGVLTSSTSPDRSEDIRTLLNKLKADLIGAEQDSAFHSSQIVRQRFLFQILKDVLDLEIILSPVEVGGEGSDEDTTDLLPEGDVASGQAVTFSSGEPV